MGRNFMHWIHEWESMQSTSTAPPIYHKWVAFSILAAVLERKTFLRFFEVIYPNLYIVLVGPPGIGKGTAMGPGLSMLRDIEVPLSAEATSKEAIIRKLANGNGETKLSDGNYEKYAALTIYSEEMSVFLDANDSQMMGYLCDWFDCRDNWAYETVSRGEEIIPNIYVNMIAGTVPIALRTIVNEGMLVSGGLRSRTLYIYADQGIKQDPVPFELDDKTGLLITHNIDSSFDKLSADLQKIKQLEGQFRMDRSFINTYHNWMTNNGIQQKKEAKTDNEKSYHNRRPTHLIKLSMLISVSKSDSMWLTAEDFVEALVYLEEAEKFMHKAFQGTGRSNHAETIHSILTYLQLNEAATYDQLFQQFFMETEDFDTILETVMKLPMIHTKTQTVNGKVLKWYFYKEMESDNEMTTPKPQIDENPPTKLSA